MFIAFIKSFRKNIKTKPAFRGIVNVNTIYEPIAIVQVQAVLSQDGFATETDLQALLLVGEIQFIRKGSIIDIPLVKSKPGEGLDPYVLIDLQTQAQLDRVLFVSIPVPRANTRAFHRVVDTAAAMKRIIGEIIQFIQFASNTGMKFIGLIAARGDHPFENRFFIRRFSGNDIDHPCNGGAPVEGGLASIHDLDPLHIGKGNVTDVEMPANARRI